MENPAEMNVTCNAKEGAVNGTVKMGGPDAGTVIVTSLGILGVLGTVACCCFGNRK